MALLPESDFQIDFPIMTDLAAVDIKAHTNFELFRKYPDWDSNNASWEDFVHEIGRLSLRAGNSNVRTYLYTDKQKMLGIFIRHGCWPVEDQ